MEGPGSIPDEWESVGPGLTRVAKRAAQGMLQQQVNGQPESLRLKRQLDRVYAGLRLPLAHG